jgi:hypothetical protein
LTPHFGVAATSPPFSPSAKLAVVMDKTSIPHAGGLAASTCRERRRAPAKPAETSFPFGPSSVARRPLFAIFNPPSSILGLHPHAALSSALRIPHSANPLIIKPDPAQSCLIKPTCPSSNPLLPLIHQSKLLVHPCPSVSICG